MSFSRRALVGATLAAPLLPSRPARAQGAPIRIGVLTDLSGIYRDNSGPAAVACAQQAADEFASANGLRAEVVAGDHQNKADVVTDVHALGLQTAQGLTLTETFYWDLNDRTRAFTKRVCPAPRATTPTWARPGAIPARCTTSKRSPRSAPRRPRTAARPSWTA